MSQFVVARSRSSRRHSRKWTSCFVLACSSMLSLSCLPVRADTVIWIGGNGAWNVAGNWDTGKVPTAADDVFNNNTTDTITISGSAQNAQTLNNNGIINVAFGILNVSSTAFDSANSGTLLASNGSMFSMSAAIFGNSGLIDASNGGNFTFSSTISMTNTATGIIATDASAAAAGSTLTFNGAGTLDNAGFIGSMTPGSGGSVLGNVTGAFTNESKAKLILDSGSNLALGNSLVNSSNAGIITVSDSNLTNNSFLTLNAATFTNSKLIDASNEGQVTFNVAAQLTNTAGATISTDFSSPTIGGTLVLNGAGALDNAGFIGSKTIGSGGSVTGTLTGAFTNESTGTLALDSGSNLTLGNTGATSSNGGTITVTNSSNLTVHAGAFTNTGSIAATEQGGIDLDAPIVLAGGSVQVGANSTVTTTGSLKQTGGVTQVDGTLANSAAMLLQGGGLIGSGAITGDVNNTGGVVHPGDATPGTLAVNGSYTQTTGGKLQIDLGGSQQGVTYGLLQVGNTASLGGELDINLVNGFTPSAGGQDFTILTYGNRVGAFDNIVSLMPGYIIGIVYNDAAGTATIDIGAVPETSTLVTAGLMLGVGALLLRRRSRKSLPAPAAA